MLDAIEGAFKVKTENNAAVSGLVLQDFVLELQHGVLCAEASPKADHGVGIEFCLFQVFLPSVRQDMLENLPHARSERDGA